LDVSNNTALYYLDLSNIPTLYAVHVWEMPFPLADMILETEGSPNVYFTTEGTVNIQGDHEENSKIDIYPNPAKDYLNIVFKKNFLV